MTAAYDVLMTYEEITADPQRWLKLRREHVGASEIAAVLNLRGAFRGPVATWLAKTHPDLAAEPGDDRFSLGLFLEPYVAGRLAGLFPDSRYARGGLYASRAHPVLAATPDYLETTPDGVTFPVQVKSVAMWRTDDPAHCWGTPPDGVIPPAYDAQCIQEAYVCGAPQTRLAALNRMTGELRCYDVPLDGTAMADIELFARAAAAFMRGVEAGAMPPPDGRDDTTQALRRLYPGTTGQRAVIPVRLAARYAAARAAARRAKTRSRELENQIRARMGTATIAVTADGTPAALRSIYDEQRIDHGRLRAGAPRTAARYTRPHRVDKLLARYPAGRASEKTRTEGN